MELTWLDPKQLDRRDVAGAVAVLEAARAVDTPALPGPLASPYSYRLRNGWDGEPPLTCLYRDPRGRVVAVMDLWMPMWDNTHVASIQLTVDPLVRRRGIGRQLLEIGIERVKAEGRRVVIADSGDDPAAVGFATALGLERASAYILRRQDLTAVDWSRLDREYAGATEKASGYELLRFAGTTPDDMLDAVAKMTEAINDAPTDDLDVEDEVFPPERIRKFEQSQLARGRRLYRLVARHRESGELAGHTMVGVDIERPWLAGQFDTSVVRGHRGHRLGLLLKIEMLRWLAEEEPQARILDTDNAATNDHMIAVNEIIGYQVIGTQLEWQRKLD